MDRIASREILPHDLWSAMPLDLMMSVAAVLFAACLKLAGLLG